MILNGLWCFVALGISIAPVGAQAWTAGAIIRTLEAPGHETLMAHIASADITLAPFETDGCSGGLSTVWGAMATQFSTFAQEYQSRPPWESCCVTHDQAYHNAGAAADPIASFEARLAADLALKSCVIATGADLGAGDTVGTYQRIATSMYVAVRLGGGPCSGQPWRWGHGSPACSDLDAVVD